MTNPEVYITLYIFLIDYKGRQILRFWYTSLKKTRCDGGITVAPSGGMGRTLWGGADKFVRKKEFLWG